MTGGGPKDQAQAGTPRGELTRIRESRERQDVVVAQRIEEAMLTACGERGYRSASVQDAIDRYGGNRVQFYRHFGSKDECYAAAHAAELDRLCERLLKAGAAEQSWRCGMRAGLSELASYVEERPELARGLLIEVHVAGQPALAKREQALERFIRAVDGARREAEPRNPPPPPMTATFMVGAVESAVAISLASGEPASFSAALPELAHLIVSAYFGAEEADKDLAALKAA